MSVAKATVANPPVTVNETPALGLDQVTDPTILHSITMPVGGTLHATSTPAVSKVWSDRVALVAGAKTLDLQALVNDNLPNVDFTGLKIQVWMLSVPESNSGAITMTVGAANGYDFSGGDGKVTLVPGASMVMTANNNLSDVAAADSELDFAGTGTEVFDILIIAG